MGAGVDHALTGRPLWAPFLERISDLDDADPVRVPTLHNDQRDALRRIAGEWPVETAQALRATLGTDAYLLGLSRAAGASAATANDDVPAAVVTPLAALVIAHGVRVIVSLNFSHDLRDALGPALEEAGIAIRVISRPQLSAWSVHDLLHPAEDTLHIIHVHGTIDAGADSLSGPILDRQGYDQAVFSDLHYEALLTRLFEDFTVLSCGVSWTDVPLRNAAARSRYAYPIVARRHVAIMERHQAPTDRPEIAPHLDNWAERALVSSYSVRPLYFTSKKYSEAWHILNRLASLDQCLRRRLSITSTDFDLLPGIADELDHCGDFESQLQRQ